MEINFRMCPRCGVFIEKLSSCNYVRCESLICQKKTVFCFLCNEFLIEKKIKSHYQNENPYNSCNSRQF